jgi:hypothetical protein
MHLQVARARYSADTPVLESWSSTARPPPRARRHQREGCASAAAIFDDPNLLVVIDSRTYGERRYQTIGASRGVILFVAYTMRADNSLPDYQRQEGEPS